MLQLLNLVVQELLLYHECQLCHLHRIYLGNSESRVLLIVYPDFDPASESATKSRVLLIYYKKSRESEKSGKSCESAFMLPRVQCLKNDTFG